MTVVRIISDKRIRVPDGEIGLDPEASDDPTQNVIFQAGASTYPVAKKTITRFKKVVGNHCLGALVEFNGVVNMDLNPEQQVVFPLIIDHIVRVADIPSSPIQSNQLSSQDCILYLELFDMMFPGRLEVYGESLLEMINKSRESVLNEDGNILVVVSSSCGSWITPENMSNPAFVREVQAFKKDGKPQSGQKSAIYPNNELRDLSLFAIPKGMPFRVEESDGYQIVTTKTEFMDKTIVLY